MVTLGGCSSTVLSEVLRPVLKRMLAPLSPSSVRVRAQSATAEQLTRQLAVVVTANNQLEQQLLQLETQQRADQQRIQWLERLLEKAPPAPRPPGPPILEQNVRETSWEASRGTSREASWEYVERYRTLKWDGAKIHDGERGAYVDSGALAACFLPVCLVHTSLSITLTRICATRSRQCLQSGRRC